MPDSLYNVGKKSYESRPLKYVFAASTGGHLAQLVRFAEKMNASPDSMWITFQSPQSESLLRGKRVTYVPYISSRDCLGVIRAFRQLRRLIKAGQYDEVVSTGAALALAVFPAAALARVPRTYIESVSRVNGPSMTGRIVAFTHLAELRTQHAQWSNKKWRNHPSVLSLFKCVQIQKKPRPKQLKVFVTLGTISPYRFDSLVDALLRTGVVGVESTWQLGVTDRGDLPGQVFNQVSEGEFRRFAAEADVVVTHAGVGSILSLLEQGIYPVVVPRRRSRREHVDDHQEQITELVKRLGISETAEAVELDAETLRSVIGKQIVPV